jgi:hypothetical protein
MRSTNTNTTTPSPVHETHEEDPLLNSQLGSDDDCSDADRSDVGELSDFDEEEEETLAEEEAAPAEEEAAPAEEEAAPAEEEAASDEEETAAPAEEEAASDDEEDQPNTLQKNLRAAEEVQRLLEMIEGRKEVMKVLGNEGQVRAAEDFLKQGKRLLDRADDLFKRALPVLKEVLEETQTSPKRPMVKKATTRKKPMDPKRLPTQVLGVELSEGVKEALVCFREGKATVEDMDYILVFMSDILDGPLSNARALNPIDAHEAFLTAKGDKTRPNFDDEAQGLYIFVKFISDSLLLASKHYSVAKSKSDLPEGGALVVENMTRVINTLALTHGLNPAINCRRMPSEKNMCGATTAETGVVRLLSFLRFALDGSLGFDFTRQVKKALAKAIADLEKSQ